MIYITLFYAYHYSKIFNNRKKCLLLYFFSIKVLLFVYADIFYYNVGVSPSGKASAFGADIRWFESSHPSQQTYKTLFLQGLFYCDIGDTLKWHSVPQLCTTRGLL